MEDTPPGATTAETRGPKSVPPTATSWCTPSSQLPGRWKPDVLRPGILGRCKDLVVVVIVVVLTLTRIIKSVVTGQAPVTPKLSNTPEKEHKQTKGGTRIYHS